MEDEKTTPIDEAKADPERFSYRIVGVQMLLREYLQCMIDLVSQSEGGRPPSAAEVDSVKSVMDEYKKLQAKMYKWCKELQNISEDSYEHFGDPHYHSTQWG